MQQEQAATEVRGPTDDSAASPEPQNLQPQRGDQLDLVPSVSEIKHKKRFFEAWKVQRAAERKALKQKEKNPAKVPFKLTSDIQLWVPVELLRVVQTLWEKAAPAWEQGTQEYDNSQDPDFDYSYFRALGAFLAVVYETKPETDAYSTTKSRVALSPASRTYLLRLAFSKFHSSLKGNNIHALPNQASEETKKILRVYLAVSTELRESGYVAEASNPSPSALLAKAKEGQVGLMSVFGGQGVSWLPELRDIYFQYSDLRPILDSVINTIQELARDVPQFFSYGFDVLSWISAPSTSSQPASTTPIPSAEYLASAPVSYPMLGLVSLANYLLVIKAWGLPVAEVVKLFKAATGHSQGITAAVVFGSAESEEELTQGVLGAVRLMFWLGVRLQQVSTIPAAVPSQRADIIAESIRQGDSLKGPTPMLAVFQLLPSVVQGFVDRINKTLADKPERQLEITLINGPRSVVVVGHPESLHSLATLLRSVCTRQQDQLDQSRIPFSKRKKEYSILYLPVSVPFHSARHLQDAAPMVLEDAHRSGLDKLFRADRLRLPVYSPNSGEDLRKSSNLLADLINLQCKEHVNWLKATQAASVENGVTHIIDWGPGGHSGIGSVCRRNMEGNGIQVVFAAHEKNVLLDCRPSAIPFALNWRHQYAPRLIRRNGDNQLIVDTHFSRVIGKPPVLVAGMTPTTVNHEIVAAALNAGYYAELAGGGLPREASFRGRVKQLLGALDPGHGVTFNLLFLNPRLWGFQYPLSMQLAKEGVPVDGITIAAGVPSLEKSVEIICNLQAAGLKHVSFKPGSIASIQLVVQIAQQVPDMPVILQWTGGRGGGHHSFEDFHEPILQTYATIRSQKNIVLVAGSGFGDAKDSWPYLTGEWSIKFGYSAMPFDAILVSSRVMVCKEAATALQAKELLVSTPGIDVDARWEDSYDGVAGGIITVTSELGEPIHKVATRGIKLWRELDQQIFSLPREKQGARIAEKKDYIVAKLNADFQKVYFGRKEDGRVVDLPEMTYADVALRMIQLMYRPPKQSQIGDEKAQSKNKEDSDRQRGRWIHGSYLDRLVRFLQLLEERFAGDTATASQPAGGAIISHVPDRVELQQHPRKAVEAMLAVYPLARIQLLSSEDVDVFIQICRQKGKPVNFVPVIDQDLQFWFKKDSLWQSEDLDAVEGCDVGRVAILQGPIAVRYSTKVNEPVADVLNGIHSGWVSYLLAAQSEKEAAPTVPEQEYVGDVARHLLPLVPLITPETKGISITDQSQEEKRVRIITTDRTHQQQLDPDLVRWWFSLLSIGDGWWRALLGSEHLARGHSRLPNRLRELFVYRAGQTIRVTYSEDNRTLQPAVEEVTLVISNTQSSLHGKQEQGEKGRSEAAVGMLRLALEKDNVLLLTLYHQIPSSSSSLAVRYRYHPEQGGWAPIHELPTGYCGALREFYSTLWLSPTKTTTDNSNETALQKKESLLSTKFAHSFVVSQTDVLHFNQAIGRSHQAVSKGAAVLSAPVDFAIVVAWESLIKPLFFAEIGGDLLQLVHLSNSFKQLGSPRDNNGGCFSVGEQVTTRVEIVSVDDLPSGRRVSVRATLGVDHQELLFPRMEVVSQFLFRRGEEEGAPIHPPFRKTEDQWTLPVDTHTLAVLRSKPWIHWLARDGAANTASSSSSVPPLASSTAQKTEEKEEVSSLPRSLTENITEPQVGEELLVTLSSTEIVQTLERGQRNTHHVDIEVRGKICNRKGVELAQVDYGAKGVRGNVPEAVFNRLGKRTEEAAFFPEGGYSLLSAPDVVNAPDDNQTYAIASRDFNPIHTNPLFATFANLPSTITHGMWSSANARRVIESYVANDQAEKVLYYSAEFTGMVLPRDQLTTRVKHVGMRNGRMLLEVTTHNQDEQLVLKGKAEVRSPKTVYVFTGQGSASVGMGMDLYSASPVAKAVWDRADSYFVQNYGFSILRIVRENPKNLTLHFGGVQGRLIKSKYQALKQRVRLHDGEMEERPLFPEITDSISTFTFGHPDGLLFATQFSQPALVLVELAAFRDMQDRALVPDDCVFAGHSLGEYAALASVAAVMSIESLVDIVFLRGMTMQNAVLRDEKGRSNYGMVAVNPSRVHPTLFRESHLHQLIEAIVVQRPELLQVVNYNIENNQYVVAGELGNLNVLGLVLSELKKDPKKATDVVPLITSAIQSTEESKLANGGLVELVRGEATIPLPGIDVPFHSKFLEDGVPAFRHVLQQRMKPESIDPSILVGRYIPNVTAQPFSLNEAYVRTVFERTKSEILGKVLLDFSSYNGNPQKLAHLLLLELLAYQFASPVRWIETQHLLFASNGYGVEKFIEVGPAPTLVTMAQRTLASGNYSPLISREILWYGRDKDKIYFNHADSAEASTIQPSAEVAVPVQQAPSPPPAVVASPTPSVMNVAPVADSPVNPLHFLRVLLAVRMKQKLDSIAPDGTIKQLAGGKSALQNEIIGDMEKEFACKAEDSMGELPLAALASKAGASYQRLGDVSNSLISKMLSRKMPGGISLSSLRAHLLSKYSLPDGRIQSVLLHSLTMEPSDRLSSEGDATAWLDSVVASYSSFAGLSLSSAASQPATAVSAAPVAASVGASFSSMSDEGPTALDALTIILSGKLKTDRGGIQGSSRIRDLVGGKSALQNEVVGDVSKEFGKPLEGEAADLPLSELATKLQTSYGGPGPYLQSQVAKLVNSYMPGGFPLSGMRAHLNQLGLPPRRVEATLLWGLSHNHLPSSRFASDADAKKWLEAVAADYVAAKGLSLGSSAAGAGAGAVMATGAVVDTAALKKYEQRVSALAREQAAALQRYLGEDPLSPIVALQEQQSALAKLQRENDSLREELGDFFLDNIRPMFDPKKERRYDSSWNWTRQDCLVLYYDYACGRAQEWNRDIRERLYRIKNRVTSTTVEMCEFYKKKALEDGHGEIVSFITILADTLRKVLSDPPVYRELSVPTSPYISISDTGAIQYKEVPRTNVKDMADYVLQLRSTLPATAQKVDFVSVLAQLSDLGVDPKLLAGLQSALSFELSPVSTEASRKAPFVFLRRTELEEDQSYHSHLTAEYMKVLHSMAMEGVSFVGKVVLVTGCGADSIGLELVKGLLRGGAKVYATTSRFSREGAAMYHSVFDQHGTRGSRLVILPFNQASSLDVAALVDHIYTTEKEDIDFLIPFAAIPENGRDIGSIDSRAELAHRLMLTNLIRLIGAVKTAKEQRGITTRPGHVILPLSPNHGMFGFDGLYAESKLGLHSLLHKWRSEGWKQYLSIAGAIIGWTRGTGLMSANNIVAPGIEELGVRTFSSLEICFNILGLLHPSMVAIAQGDPVLADLNGGLHAISNLNDVLSGVRQKLQEESALRKAIASDAALDAKLENAAAEKEELPVSGSQKPTVTRRANMVVNFPELPSAEKHRALREQLGGMVDLDSVVVVVGFGEVGPYGNARTRWEMEAYGSFSLEGTIELAWMMGLIRYEKNISPEKNGTAGVTGCGWVDANTGEYVPDHQIKARYEKTILAHTGIRLIEPELFDGYDPKNKTFFQQVALNEDMEPMEVSAEEALHFKRKHQQFADVWHTTEGLHYVRLRKGAVLYIPKAMNFNRFVAGQVPTSWDPAVLGISQDIIQQVDRVTLFSLVSTVEALVSAGITDPYEFYKYVHVSEVGNTIGGGFGGMQSVRKTHLDTLLEKPVAGDVLQEQFINTVAAWVNMLLLSSSGPIKTPVGACATAVESLEVGMDTILSGKAKIVVVGGYDDFGEEGSYGFAQMNATSNAAEEAAAGREPLEMSRPATSTRSGFMEAHGAGVEILMTAKLAIDMGVPIYAILAHVATATDKEGRSVPAPGQGILVTAREKHGKYASPLLDISYRRDQLKQELAFIREWQGKETERLKAIYKRNEQGSGEKEKERQTGVEEEDEQLLEHLLSTVERQAQRKAKAAYEVWGSSFYVGNPEIAPLRGALAVWGLHPDDIAVASMHGTGTHANDLNESHILQKQLTHLGRSKGNVVMPIFQKYLTGHPKGAAAAWMLNGMLQSMMTGIVPGNRNADNIDQELQDCDKLVFLNRTVETYGYKAGLLKSFGFGQVGGEVLVIHPDHVFSQLSPEQLELYSQARLARQHQAYRHVHDAVTRRRPYVQLKTQPPYQEVDEEKIYLDPTARADYSTNDATWVFPRHRRQNASEHSQRQAEISHPEQPKLKSTLRRSLSGSALTNLEVALREMGEGNRTTADRGIGVDVQIISEIDVSVSNSEEFVRRNFTESEVEYCRGSADPAASFAGRWAAKEAIVKALTSCDVEEKRNLWEGASGALREIEILRSGAGAPRVHLHGHPKEVASLLGVSSVTVTISHSGEYAIAQAVAK